MLLMINSGYVRTITVIQHHVCNVRISAIGAFVIDSSNVRDFRNSQKRSIWGFLPTSDLEP